MYLQRQKIIFYSVGVFGRAMGVSGRAMGVFGKWLRLQIDLLAFSGHTLTLHAELHHGCVPIPRTHPSKAAFEGCVDADCITATRQVLSQFQGSFKCGLRMQPSFPGFEGCIGCILHGPTYPKILHGPTYPSQDSLRTQSMEMAENGDLSSAFKCKYLVSSHSSI